MPATIPKKRQPRPKSGPLAPMGRAGAPKGQQEAENGARHSPNAPLSATGNVSMGRTAEFLKTLFRSDVERFLAGGRRGMSSLEVLAVRASNESFEDVVHLIDGEHFGDVAARVEDAYIVAPMHNRKAALASRGDVLTRFIEHQVRANPKITWKQLLQTIEHSEAVEFNSVTDEAIEWTEPTGNERSALVSGLKDRLSRVKSKNKSR